MVNHYTTPEVEVVQLSNEDVITASTDTDGPVIDTDNPEEGWTDIF